MGSEIQNKLQNIENELSHFKVRLLPVTKTFPVEKILQAYEAGYREFGENKVQEVLLKKDQLPSDVQWHIIGHLQTNKVKSLVPFVSLIHSVDSEKLVSEINKQAEKIERQVPCLLQVFISDEETKFGWDPEELKTWVQNKGPEKFPYVQFKGLMGMASNTLDEDQVRSEFRMLRSLFEHFKGEVRFSNFTMEELSMGMSNDFIIACEEGSTIVRMGSAIFGGR